MSEQISGKQAKEAAQRLINSHFGNADPARMSIPARSTDDDLTIMAYIEQAEARRASPAPPTTEGREEAREAAKRIVETYEAYINSGISEGRAQSDYVGARREAPTVARALLSSPRVEDVRREERERIAKIFEGQPYSEWFGQEAADMILALSPPDGDGKQEQARPSGSAPISTDTKDTIK